ncbi:hypothetical protein [Streptomyces sp. NPDC004286]|uniref:hypothetical protein n=1 Tax=Streptomyces sp. NPDC004286 TaxID=3364696 RepID=UPI003691D91D
MDLLGGADPDVAVAAGALCLYRIAPLLPQSGTGLPQWKIAEADWADLRTLPQQIDRIVRSLREGLSSASAEADDEALGELHEMASEMILRYTDVGPLDQVEWADWCSTLALDIHQQLDELLDDSDQEAGPRFFPAGTEPELTFLQALELEDQIRILKGLSEGSRSLQAVIRRAEDGRTRVREALSRLV